MKPKFRLPLRGSALFALLSGAALLAGAPLASAETTAHPAEGMLKVPNVRIETASSAQIAEASKPATTQSTLRAYKDPITGELRDPTPEELFACGISTKSAAVRPKATVTTTSKGTLIQLDDTFLSNAVASKDAAGTTRMPCVTGDEAAVHALDDGKAGQEHGNER
jgi:hypothetical protein